MIERAVQRDDEWRVLCAETPAETGEHTRIHCGLWIRMLVGRQGS
jgi:hypothetical protein